MEFVEIKLRNFRPYYGTVTFEPRITADRPLVLIQGKNDTGKTSLFSAIRFTLFGADSRSTYSDVINRRAVTETAGTTKVTLTFEHDDEIFIIERGIEFDQVADPDQREATDWYREVRQPDGVYIEREASESEYRKFINRLIPENVAQFFLFDAEKLERFEKDHDETVRESIETVLGIQEIENAIDDLADRKHEFERNLANIESTVDTVNELRDDLRQVMDEIETIGDDSEGKIIEIQREIRQKEQSLTDVNNALQEAEGADELQDELDQVEAEIGDFQEELDEELIPERNKLRREVGPMIVQSAADVFTEHYDIEGAQGEASVIDSLLDRDRCLCGEELTENKRQHLLERYQRLRGAEYRRLSQLKELASDLQIDVETKLRHYQQVQQQIRQQRGEIEDLETEKERLEEKLDSIEQQYSEELKARKKELENEIAELEDNLNELRERRGELRNEKERLQGRIESMGGASEEERHYSALIDLAEDCRAAFDDIKDELVKTRRASVEEAASETFMRLTNRPDYYEGLRITRNYELRVLTETAERSIAEQRPSAGQRQIIAYSFIAGLSRFTTRNAPVIIDTPIGRLDPEHKNNLINFYHEFSDQVIILYQPNELTGEDIDIMGDNIAKHFRITIQDDESSTIEELSHPMSIPAED